MRTRIQKWGNSLAVRIPSPLAKELDIAAGKEMDIHSKNGQIVLVAGSRRYELAALISRIQKENLHSEIDTGVHMGNEIW